MSGGCYGGDEVGALVLDIGSHSVRAGYAGEEQPKSVFPNCTGIFQQEEKDRKLYYDSTYLNVPRSGVEIVSPMGKNGLVENWDIYENLLDYTIRKRLHSDPEFHPILMSEPAWNTKEQREKLLEIMFEKFNIPAFFIVKSPVLTAFANGRASGLIVDSGATHTTAVPVYEGHVLRRGIITSPLGGNFVQNRMGEYLVSEKVNTHLSCEIKEKTALEKANELPIFKLKSIPEVTKSWRGYQQQLLREDVIRNVCQLSEGPFREEEAAMRPQEEYEFPTGFRKSFGVERFKIPEPIFNPTLIDGKSSICGAAFLVSNSVHLCDPDIRSQLMSNVILTGGNSLLTGFSDRLVTELQARTPPALRFKLINLQSQQMTAERLFSPWIGGSILGSLGTFHQMWISKKEYEDQGKQVLEQKCL